MYFTNGYMYVKFSGLSAFGMLLFVANNFYSKVMNNPDDGGLPSVKLFYLPGDEEESQEDIGEYLVSQGAFR